MTKMPSVHGWIWRGPHRRTFARRRWACRPMPAIGPTQTLQIQFVAFPRGQILAIAGPQGRPERQVAQKDVDNTQIIGSRPAEYNTGDGPKCQQNGHDRSDTGDSPRPLSLRSNRPKGRCEGSTSATFLCDIVDCQLRSVSPLP